MTCSALSRPQDGLYRRLTEVPPTDDDLDDELDDDLDDELDDDQQPLKRDAKLPPLYSHGDADPRPLRAWAIKNLIPLEGKGLLSVNGAPPRRS